MLLSHNKLFNVITCTTYRNVTFYKIPGNLVIFILGKYGSEAICVGDSNDFHSTSQEANITNITTT